MTSTEALDKIERSTDVTKETSWETTVSNPYFGEIQTIRKDLEVLGILKERCASANITRWGLCKKGEDKKPSIFVVLFNSLGTLPGIALWKAAEKSGIGESRRLEGGDSK